LYCKVAGNRFDFSTNNANLGNPENLSGSQFLGKKGWVKTGTPAPILTIVPSCDWVNRGNNVNKTRGTSFNMMQSLILITIVKHSKLGQLFHADNIRSGFLLNTLKYIESGFPPAREW
jgi:hypothetical protein